MAHGGGNPILHGILVCCGEQMLFLKVQTVYAGLYRITFTVCIC